MNKKELRKQIRKDKKDFTADELISKSQTILSHLEELKAFQDADTILFYHSLPDEVFTHDIIKKYSSTKKIVLPVVVGDYLILRTYDQQRNLKIGSYDIFEPTGELFEDYEKIDLAIIPGMAFDSDLHRLGRGKGYYDRLLPNIKCPKIGICFDFQYLDHEEIPTEKFDINMDQVIYQ